MLFVRKLLLTVVAFLILTEPRCIIGGSGCNGSAAFIDLSFPQNGTIYSPGYPNSYNNFEDCSWLIQAPPGQKVLIYFTKFDIEDSSQCRFDSVNIFDGLDIFAPRSLKSCGNRLPPPVYSSGRNMYVQFTSDWSEDGRGFVAHYRALSSSSGCPSIVPGASVGVIYSPNFPWSYPTSKTCEWVIMGPRDRNIKINFMRFDLKPLASYGRCVDYVELRDKYYNVIGKPLCGNQINSSVTFNSYGTMYVRFSSDYTTKHYSGFLAFYDLTGFTPYTRYPHHRTKLPYHRTTYPYHRTTKPTIYTPFPRAIHACKPHSQTNIYVESSSSISSPKVDDYDHTNSPQTSCSFHIYTKKGYILKLTFSYMAILSCSDLSKGYVKVYDGSTESAPLLGIYCVDNRKDTRPTTGNHMFVQYYGPYSWSAFRATVHSQRGTPVNIAGIAVPLVIALILFTIIIFVIKRTTIKRSTETATQSDVNEAPIQRSPLSVELPPTSQSLPSYTEVEMNLPRHPHPANTGAASPETSQPSALNGDLAPPSYSELFATHGATNMTQEDRSVQV